MKTRIEIEFDDPAERDLAVTYLCAEAYVAVISDFLNKIRETIKYTENLPPCCEKRLAALRELVYDGLADVGKGVL